MKCKTDKQTRVHGGLALLLPLGFYLAYTLTDAYAFRACLTLSCLVIVAVARGVRRRWLVVAGLAFSLVGDILLSHSHGRESFFLGGLSAFLVGHLWFIAYCLSHGRFRLTVFLATLLPILGLYVLLLRPGIKHAAVRCGVLSYAVVSCFSLASAFGLRDVGRASAWLFRAGIASLFFSDMLIGLQRFGGGTPIYFLMLPTYFLSQFLIAASLIWSSRTPR